MKNIHFFLNLSLQIVIVSLLSSLISCQQGVKPDAPVLLTCELMSDPIGIDKQAPVLSWQLVGNHLGVKQKAYKILVASSSEMLEKDEYDIWDSGKVISDQSVYVTYKGKPLLTGATYFWKVKVWNEAGNSSDYSDPARWEMALMKDQDWKASWVVKSAVEDPGQSVLIRKAYKLKSDVIKARVYVTGLGGYVFYVNGKKVGKDILTPGWTEYPKRVQYQIYDIKDLLLEGDNVFGATLGNLWWSGGLGWSGKRRYSEGPLKLLAQIVIEYADGSLDVIATGPDWKWHSSPILSNSIYDGVTYDARLELGGWNRPGFDDDKWEQVNITQPGEAKLVVQQADPIHVTHQLKPISVKKTPANTWVFDFGQNMAGWARLKVKGKAGDRVTMKFAELLHKDGTVAQENLRTAKATDVYILKGGEPEIWEPMFTYHGFRYVELSDFPGTPDKETLTGMVFHSDNPWIGSFECSDKLVNSIYKNITWGQRGNLMSVPTDCPQRDERLGWMGDTQIFSPTACYNMDMTRFFEKWMHDITDCQDETGFVNDVNPAIVVVGPAKPAWGDAVSVIPWNTYKFTGDRRVLEDNYENVKAWVEYMRGLAKDNLYIWANEDSTWFGYADWIAPVKSPAQPVSVSYYFYSTKILSEMAAVLGHDKDVKTYSSLAKDIAKAYQNAYFDDQNQNYEGGTQTANLLPLAFGITPDDLKETVARNVANDVIARDVHPSTGFLGTGYILQMLSDHGYHELAWKMVRQTSYPSWGYMVANGATSIWELWDSNKQPPEQMNSRNHFALGCIGDWLFSYLAGINPDIENPGYKRSIIAPKPAEGLDWAKASVETHYGRLSSSWKFEAGVFTLDVEIPANTTSIVRIPVRGTGEFSVQANNQLIYNEDKAVDNTLCIVITDERKDVISFEVPSGTYAFIVK